MELLCNEPLSPLPERLTFPDGSVCCKVSKEKYLRYEQIRNYILRNEFEKNAKRWLLIYRAMSKFRADEDEIDAALHEWKDWYYDNGVRHRPIEAFFDDFKKEQQLDKSVELIFQDKTTEGGNAA